MFGRPKNLTESVFPLISMYALIGHGIFRFPAHKPRIVFSVIWTIVLVSFYLVVLACTLDYIFKQPWYSDDERIVFVVIYVNVAITVIGVIISWCYAKDLTKVDETLQELGTTFNYARSRNFGYALILLWIAMIIVFNGMDSLWFYNVIPIGWSYFFATVLHHPVHINSIVAFNFCVGVRLIGARYEKANTILEGLKKSVQPIKINAWQKPRNKKIFQSINTISPFGTRQVLRTAGNHKCLIQIIKQVHLELRRIGKGLDDAYGFQMAFEIAALFVMFTGLLYELYILAITPLGNTRKYRMVVVGMWISIYFMKLIVINEVCERVCTEARRTGEIIHCLLDKSIEDSELPNEINQFSLQLMHDPVTFSPVGLVTFGHKFVKSFLGTVTTYLVILIQMTPSKSGAAQLRQR